MGSLENVTHTCQASVDDILTESCSEISCVVLFVVTVIFPGNDPFSGCNVTAKSTFGSFKHQIFSHFRRQAFHGTWFYGIWNILARGFLLPRDNMEVDLRRRRGHVYVTPGFGTAKAFAPPHDLFGIGVYECVIVELRVHENCVLHRRTRGSYTQWCLNPEDVYIVGVWFGVNVGNEAGRNHVEAWRPHLEIRPAGRQVWTPNPPQDEWYMSPDKSAPRGCVWPELWSSLTDRNVVDTIGAMWDPNA